MADLDENTLELLERRLADQVIARVRPELFRLYGVAGGAVIAVLGLIGWSILGEMQNHARSRAEQATGTILKESTDQLAKLNSQINSQLGIADWLSQRARTLSEKVDGQLQQLEPRTKLLEELGNRVTEIRQRRREIADTLARASSQAYETVEISRQIADLTRQIQDLSARQALGTAPAPPEAKTALDNLANAALSTHAKVVDITNRPTVWFQFAGGSRVQAEEFARALETKSYLIPGEERVAGAANLREVRYFFPEDTETAKRLAADATEVFRSLDYGPNAQVAAKSLVSYEGKKPKQGTLELWVELPPQRQK